jgi:hypothetical protein
MGRIWAGSGRVEQEEVVVAATSGDQAAFTALADRYRWELHCGTVALSRNVLAKPSKVEALLHGRAPRKGRTTRPCP